MRNLILFILLFTATSVNAQEVVKDSSFYCYCEVYLDGKIGVIRFPFSGDKRKVLYSNDDCMLKFVNDNELLTYMSYRGWDYVECSLNKLYIMRKKVNTLNDMYDRLKYIEAGVFDIRKSRYAKLDD